MRPCTAFHAFDAGNAELYSVERLFDRNVEGLALGALDRFQLALPGTQERREDLLGTQERRETAALTAILGTRFRLAAFLGTQNLALDPTVWLVVARLSR